MFLITGDIVYSEFWKDHSGCGVENGLMGVIEKIIAVKGACCSCPPDTQEVMVAWTGVVALKVKKNVHHF